MNENIDPFQTPMVFLRIGWMDRYRGLRLGDTIERGGGYISEHGFGHEIFNFRPHKGRLYAYVQPSRGGKKGGDGNEVDIDKQGSIDVAKLGAKKHDDLAEGVLAIWCATAPEGGANIVGWFSNATVFRKRQPPPAGSQRSHNGKELGYFVTCCCEDATVLPIDERVFEIPQNRKKGCFGQCNVWYAHHHEFHRELRLCVLDYISRGTIPQQRGNRNPSDLLRRLEIEEAAVHHVATFYRNLGYEVTSVEGENVGWDLTAIKGARQLQLEVKGLSGSRVDVQLTPNEFEAMNRNRATYRLCVVTAALQLPVLDIFSYSPESERWESKHDKILNVEKIVAARCTTT